VSVPPPLVPPPLVPPPPVSPPPPEVPDESVPLLLESVEDDDELSLLLLEAGPVVEVVGVVTVVEAVALVEAGVGSASAPVGTVSGGVSSVSAAVVPLPPQAETPKATSRPAASATSNRTGCVRRGTTSDEAAASRRPGSVPSGDRRWGSR
jgi:hypothetical protein